MRKAVLLVATHHRPELLKVCLQRAKQFVVPDGWSFGIVVGVNRGDAGVDVAKALDAQVAVAKDTIVTAKFSAALRDAPEADLYLMTGDDDLHSPHRLEDTVALWERGEKWISSEGSWFYDVNSRKAAFWASRTPGRMGTFHAFDGALLREKGWPEARRSADQALTKHLGLVGTAPAALPARVGMQSVCLSHNNNISEPRPYPNRHCTVIHGAFWVTGHDVSDMPESLQELVHGLS